MAITTHPLTAARFDDFTDVVNASRRTTHCWCVTHRLRQREIDELGGGDREQAMRRLAGQRTAPGVLAYNGDTPVGWCNLGPQADIPRLVHSKLIPDPDDEGTWSIICVVVRSGHRKQGVTTPLLEGAVAYAFREGATAVEAYPVDPSGRMDTTMAFVGTRAMFERVGFEVSGTTKAVAGGMPRLVMRRNA